MTEEDYQPTEGHDDEEQHETHEVYAVLLPWFLQAVGICIFYILTRKLHHLPYTAVMFIIGMFMGYGAARREDHSNSDNQLGVSIRQWTNIDYEVLFCVFLPGLLFKDAFEINFHLFQASLGQLMILAFPLVLAGTLLTALVAMYVFPYEPGWSFNMSLTLGSILAATDPVAVSALLNEVGAPPRLKTHISGESLLNDGSAVVFFYVFAGLFLHDLGLEGFGGNSTAGEAVKIFFRMSLGGTAVGFAFALGLLLILYKLDRRMEREETILQVTATVTVAYLCFYTSEVVCAMSGVIAVVTCGIVTKVFGGSLISDWQVMESFWGLLEHLLNTVIFALGGIVFGEVIERKTWDGTDWGYLIVLYLFVNIIRFFLLFGFYPLNRKIGLGTNWQETVFASWGGLRGAVGITLALALDNLVWSSTEQGDQRRVLTTKLFGYVGGIALLTLCINGTTSGPLLTKLGLADSTDARQRIVDLAREATRRRLLDDFIHLMTDRRFYFVDFALVQHHCPPLRNLTAKALKAAVEQNRESVHPKLYKAPELQNVLPYIKDSGEVRATMIKAKDTCFFSVVTRSETHMYDLEEEGGEEEQNPTEKKASSSPGLIRDTRLMFVELLRAAYTSQIKDGELDPRELDGFLVKTLFQSLDFAHDKVLNDEPLLDWDKTHIGSAKIVYKSENFVHNVFRCCCALRMGPSERYRNFIEFHPFQFDQLRLEVLQALSFIDAHKEAQDRLEDEFGDSHRVDATHAFQIVMSESKSEVRKAQKVLKAQNKKKLNHIISHYLCTILNNKEARHVKLLLDSGVLLHREGRQFLEEIDDQIKEIRKCTLEKHPGSMMDYADGEPTMKREEGDVGGESGGVEGEEEKDEEEGGLRRRWQRKRLKQKSIL